MTNHAPAAAPAAASAAALCALLMLLYAPDVAAMQARTVVAAATDIRGVQPYDDFHYPSEEHTEARAAATPALTAVGGDQATMTYKGKQYFAKLGDSVGEWRVVGLSGAATRAPFAVVEREWSRWGRITFLYTDGTNMPLRKSVGALESIRQPYFNFTGSDPEYFTKIAAGLDDVAAQTAANLTTDGEPDYPSLAAVLAPQRDLASISNPEDVVKFVVTCVCVCFCVRLVVHVRA